MPGNPGFITVEIVMFFGLGFLLAALLMLAFMPAVHERAVRLTRRKYDPVPLSEKEMHAEKDRLRADFAISTRKLEHDIDRMQRNTAVQFTELARRADTITQLKETLDTRDTLIAELQSQTERMAAAHANTESELHALKIENIAKAQALHEANQRIAALMSEIGALTAALNRRIHVYDTQQHEIVALTSQSDALRRQLEALARAGAPNLAWSRPGRGIRQKRQAGAPRRQRRDPPRARSHPGGRTWRAVEWRGSVRALSDLASLI